MFAKHPHVVSLLDDFTTRDRVHMVMELCVGGGLETYLHKNTPADAVAVVFMEQLMSAIACVHRADFVHCDVKPANIMLAMDEDGTTSVRLSDFGIAHHCAPGERLRGTFGTPGYMSPEVLRGSFNRASDIWACGCVMYECIRGEALVPDDACTSSGKQLAFVSSRAFYNAVVMPGSGSRRGYGELESALRDMLRRDESCRFTASEASVALRCLQPISEECTNARVNEPVCAQRSGRQRVCASRFARILARRPRRWDRVH